MFKIVSRYDLTFVMEIRDSTNTAINDFMTQLNNYVSPSNVSYQLQISDRLGRTTSKEQYGFIYNPAKINFVKTLQYYDANNWFERPPFVFVFEINSFKDQQFAICGCHIKPEDAVNEISHLRDVFDFYSNETFTNNTILAGDYNAGCSYVSTSAWSNVTLRTDTRFSWLISDTTDTTVAVSSCPYDRFVVLKTMADKTIATGAKFEIRNVGTFTFDSAYGLPTQNATLVSDHYPIEMVINTVSPTAQKSSALNSTTVSESTITKGSVLTLFVIMVSYLLF